MVLEDERTEDQMSRSCSESLWNDLWEDGANALLNVDDVNVSLGQLSGRELSMIVSRRVDFFDHSAGLIRYQVRESQPVVVVLEHAEESVDLNLQGWIQIFEIELVYTDETKALKQSEQVIDSAIRRLENLPKGRCQFTKKTPDQFELFQGAGVVHLDL